MKISATVFIGFDKGGLFLEVLLSTLTVRSYEDSNDHRNQL